MKITFNTHLDRFREMKILDGKVVNIDSKERNAQFQSAE